MSCDPAYLFNHDCSSLPGLLVIAYGPCSSDIVLQTANVKFAGGPAPAPAPAAEETRSVPDWLKVLGLQNIKQVCSASQAK